MHTDRELQAGVLRELAAASRVDASEIGVTVEEGVVTLSGTVATFAAREAARAAALRVCGVLDLANELEVQNTHAQPHTDEDVARAVRRALEAHLADGDAAIKSSVTHGVVALYGNVDTWQAAAEAEAAVGDVPGVQDVVDELVVRRPTFAPGVLEAEVEQTLAEHAGHPLRGIQVTVDDGITTLAGPIRSWAERETALQIARQVPGVQAVRDHLYLDGYRTAW